MKNTCISGENTKNNMSCVQRNEQTMHLKAMLTIYLANGFVNEAYEFIKPHLKMMKQNTDINVTIASCVRQSKDVILHFFVETEKFKLIKKVCRVALSGQDLLHALVNYLEAKQDLNSIAIAINLHIDHRNYSRAIFLYDKYSKVCLVRITAIVTFKSCFRCFFFFFNLANRQFRVPVSGLADRCH